VVRRRHASRGVTPAREDPRGDQCGRSRERHSEKIEVFMEGRPRWRRQTASAGGAEPTVTSRNLHVQRKHRQRHVRRWVLHEIKVDPSRSSRSAPATSLSPRRRTPRSDIASSMRSSASGHASVRSTCSSGAAASSRCQRPDASCSVTAGARDRRLPGRPRGAVRVLVRAGLRCDGRVKQGRESRCRRNENALEGHRSLPSPHSRGRTRSTGQPAWRATRSATDPKNTCLSPVRPCVPMTTTS